MRILLVEDEAPLRVAVARALRGDGHAVDEVGTRGAAALEAEHGEYGLVILDRGLPDGDGLDTLRSWRAAGYAVPVLVLTARDAVDDRISGLDSGADDYVVKPFDLGELRARVRSLARRGPTRAEVLLRVGDIELDTARAQLRRAGVLLPLRAKELAVMQVLLERRGRVVSRAQLRAACWDSDAADSNVEEATVSALRRKLGAPPVIRTRRGLGYVIDD